ncbi:MAG: T9SS type A sorting domain-containing protein [Chitinophagales bacterium]|nr:T9SS type A sorting domain-containing protein [Chitinophagales bacterium]
MRVLISTLAFFAIATGVFASPDKKEVKLRIQSQIGNLDETTVYFDYGVITDFKAQEDMQKNFSTTLPGVPVIYSLSSDNYKLMRNGYSLLTQTEIVPLGVDVDSDGVYNISAPFIDKFDATTVLRLEDAYHHVFTDLRTNFYEAAMLANEPVEGRFFLHVSYPISFVPAASGCDNNDGSIWVETDNTIEWTLCQLYDMNNVQRGTYSNINGGFDFTGLEEGDYYMVFVHGNYTTTKQFHISTNAITAIINVSKVNAYAGEELNFFSITQNVSGFEWDFGDGTQIIGIANPSLAYYTPGTFDVTLKCTNNYGCMKYATTEVEIEQISSIGNVATNEPSVFLNAKTLTVNLNEATNNGAILRVFNLLGQPVASEKITASVTSVELNNTTSGYYLVSIQNNGKTTTKRIFVER